MAAAAARAPRYTRCDARRARRAAVLRESTRARGSRAAARPDAQHRGAAIDLDVKRRRRPRRAAPARRRRRTSTSSCRDDVTGKVTLQLKRVAVGSRRRAPSPRLHHLRDHGRRQHPARARSGDYAAAAGSPSAAPCGSMNTAKRPTFGMSVGGTMTRRAELLRLVDRRVGVRDLRRTATSSAARPASAASCTPARALAVALEHVVRAHAGHLHRFGVEAADRLVELHRRFRILRCRARSSRTTRPCRRSRRRARGFVGCHSANAPPSGSATTAIVPKSPTLNGVLADLAAERRRPCFGARRAHRRPGGARASARAPARPAASAMVAADRRAARRDHRVRALRHRHVLRRPVEQLAEEALRLRERPWRRTRTTRNGRLS